MPSHFSCDWLFANLWTIAHQASLSKTFFRQEYYSGFSCPSPRDLPDLGIEPRGSDQDHPQEKKMQKAKWLSEEALQVVVKRREVKCKGEMQRYTHMNAEFQRVARRDKKAFLSDQCKEIEENNRMRKLEIPREHFMQKWAQ